MLTKEQCQRIVVLIPAYQPDEKMIPLVRQLLQENLLVLLVDDGGKEKYAHLFSECREMGAEVVVHVVNQGKGRALKTGMNAALLRWPDLLCVVTADADGQHTPQDILRVAEVSLQKPDTLVLGSRRFTGNVPAKSMWGNRITRFVYKLASGISIYDTQTGLRAIPAGALEKMIGIEGERYEYEMNMLLRLRDMNMPVEEVPIETIYIDDNAGSHFNPLRDGMRIYKVIFRYLGSAIASFVVDYVLYWLLLALKLSPLLSYILARIVSSQVNYRLNRYAVFSGRGGKYAMVKYYALAVVQGAIGAGLVQLLPTVLPVSAAVIKIPVDIILFMLSFLIQRDYVFNK